MAQIRWLHISDLHLQKENTARQEQLPNYIRKLKSVYCDIGYLFISGDIFYGKDKSVCKKAVVEYIHLLADTLDIEYSNICLVPGNHDLMQVRRNTALFHAIEGAYKDYFEQHAALGNRIITEDLLMLLERTMIEYNETYEDITGQKANGFTQNPHFIRDMGDFYMLHLNTAFLQKTSEIIVDPNRVDAALREIRGEKPLFVMGHHPLEAFEFTERMQIVNSLIDHQATLYLCGHQHVNCLQEHNGVGRDTKLIETVSASQNDRTGNLEMGFQIGSYDTVTGILSIKAFEWIPRAKKWYPDIAFGNYEGIVDLPGYLGCARRDDLLGLKRFFDNKTMETVQKGIFDEYITRTYNIEPDSCKDVFKVRSKWDFKLVNLYKDTAYFYFSVNLPKDNDFCVHSFKIGRREAKAEIIPEFKSEEDKEHGRLRLSLNKELLLSENHAVKVCFEFSYKEKLPVLYLHSSYMYPAKQRDVNINIVGNEANQWIVNATTFSAYRNARDNKPPYVIKDDDLGFSENHQNNVYNISTNSWTLPGFGYAFAITKKDHTAVCWKEEKKTPKHERREREVLVEQL